jgi:hypothetical protein
MAAEIFPRHFAPGAPVGHAHTDTVLGVSLKYQRPTLNDSQGPTNLLVKGGVCFSSVKAIAMLTVTLHLSSVSETL